MSWARATVTSVHQRRELTAGAPGVLAAPAIVEEVCDMEVSIYETDEFRISQVLELTLE
jgi:hypothetical protein